MTGAAGARNVGMTLIARRPVVLALLAVAFTGCGGYDDVAAPPASIAGLPLDYSRAGGIGGESPRLTIDVDGGATLDGFAFALDDRERAAIAAATRGVDFKGNAGGGRGDPHPDAYTYGLTAGATKVLDGDYVIPTPIAPLVTALENVSERHSAARREQEKDARPYLVVFTRTGGIDGQYVSLRLKDDASARIVFDQSGSDERSSQVSQEQLAAVRKELDAGDVADMQEPEDPNVVADGFEYTVITDGVTITASDPVNNERLDRLLLALGRIVEDARPTP